VGIGGAGDYGELKVAPDGTVMFHGKHGASGAHGKVGLEGGQPRTGVGTC